jgi:outer membrane receptor protein involved in Fe transport
MFRHFNSEVRKRTGCVRDWRFSRGLSGKKPSIGLSASLDVVYHGLQLPHYTSTTQVEFGGDTVVDFHVSKDIYEYENLGKLILRADVYNLTDRFYETMRNYPEPGRVIVFGLRYEH